jgi:hypothetical protein
MTRPRYVFLDTWVLQDYTKPAWRQRLADFIARQGFTVVTTSLLLTELYNEGWLSGGPNERGARVADFLASEHCVIAHPHTIWQAEFAAFPDQLRQLPIELDLDRIPGVPRAQALLMFLRRDPIFLSMGKDIREWANSVAQKKAMWPGAVNAIIRNALAQDYLTRDAKGRLVTRDKEVYLTTLDLRLLEDGDINRYLGRSALLRSVRLSSLVFWRRYVEPERGRQYQPMPSDGADIENISLMPYVAACTVDTKMLPTVRLVADDADCSCEVLSKQELEAALRGGGL